MSFFQVCDKANVNRKHRQLMDLSVTGEANGVGAIGLWTMAGSFSQSGAGTDGVITILDALRLMPERALVVELAALLVRVGLWHGEGHACQKCPPAPAGGWLFHDWFQFGYDTAESKRLIDVKSKELQSPKVRNAVWARDCDDDGLGRRGPCRYCGKSLRLGKEINKELPTEDRPSMDHVDPLVACGVRNIVLCCFGCNKAKAARTPDQAGMTLRPAPRPSSTPDPLDEAPAPAAAASSRSAADEQGARRQGRAQTAGGVDDLTPGVDPPNPEGSDQCGGLPTGAHGVGSGLGSGLGGVGSAQPPTKRRRRRGGRGRGGPRPPAADPGPVGTAAAPVSPAPPPSPPRPPALRWDAGAAPDLPEPGRFGSPWNNHTGPAITDRENYCPEHEVPLPCRRCTDQGGTR